MDRRGIELSQQEVNDCVATRLSVIQGDADTDLAGYPSWRRASHLYIAVRPAPNIRAAASGLSPSYTPLSCARAASGVLRPSAHVILSDAPTNALAIHIVKKVCAYL